MNNNKEFDKEFYKQKQIKLYELIKNSCFTAKSEIIQILYDVCATSKRIITEFLFCQDDKEMCTKFSACGILISEIEEITTNNCKKLGLTPQKARSKTGLGKYLKSLSKNNMIRIYLSWLFNDDSLKNEKKVTNKHIKELQHVISGDTKYPCYLYSKFHHLTYNHTHSDECPWDILLCTEHIHNKVHENVWRTKAQEMHNQIAKCANNDERLNLYMQFIDELYGHKEYLADLKFHVYNIVK